MKAYILSIACSLVIGFCIEGTATENVLPEQTSSTFNDREIEMLNDKYEKLKTIAIQKGICLKNQAHKNLLLNEFQRKEQNKNLNLCKEYDTLIEKIKIPETQYDRFIQRDGVLDSNYNTVISGPDY